MGQDTRTWWIGGLLFSLLLSGCNKTDTPTAPTPPNDVFYAAVGASDGIGFGGSVPCVPFDPDCPSGTGYVYLIKRRFQSEGRTVTLSNRSLPGAVLSGAILTLGRDIGRNDIPGTFIDQIVPFVPATTTHITIFAGGNDANVIAQNVRAGRAGPDVRAFVDQHVRQWGTDAEDMVRRLRSRAPNARIVAFNLPNLAAAPYVASNTVQERSILQRIAVGLTDRVNALTAQSVLVIDLMCEPRVYDASSFSSDGFHPNDRGYALMADLAYAALVSGAAAPPQASCGQRTLLPVF
ncbi:MAG: SGNH/GDSL hydrolase family protein [Acidobacteriota bacterium]